MASGRATLHELRTIYTVEDALHLWEAVIVPEFNDYVKLKEAQRKGR